MGLLHHSRFSRSVGDRVRLFQINSIGSRLILNFNVQLTAGPRDIDVQGPNMKLLLYRLTLLHLLAP